MAGELRLPKLEQVELYDSFLLMHSARIAEGIARRMGLPPSEVVNIRRAALVHDLGHIALPGNILRNQSQLSEADKEKLRLHPYYTERILSRVPALAAVADIAGKRHERLNGTGYYRGLSGIVTILFASWLADETVTVAFLVGGLLVLSGVYIGALAPADLSMRFVMLGEKAS